MRVSPPAKLEYCAPQSTPTQRARQLKFLDKAKAAASKKAGWFIGAHLALPCPRAPSNTPLTTTE